MVQDNFSLKGRTVAITRPVDQAEETGKLITRYGGVPYFIPSIEIKETCDVESVKHFIAELESNKIDYVLFMSVNGIRYLNSCVDRLGLKTQLLESIKKVVVLAVGPKTAQELSYYDVSVNLIPTKYSSEGIVECLKHYEIKNKTVYIPRTKDATPDLAKNLRNLGALVHELYVYESLLPINHDLMQKFVKDLQAGSVNAIIFGSSLSAKNLFKMLSDTISQEQLQNLLNNNLTIVAIGPFTADSLTKLGLRVDVMPKKYLFNETLKALAEHWSTQKQKQI
ncbi:MAG: uroporphyrinogen-III synthase [Candidatus Bathyarchaeum tardum]|nr:MAG: uroporphyrinogen-III synthase [Candidatus Bathyarchaeum tardum]